MTQESTACVMRGAAESSWNCPPLPSRYKYCQAIRTDVLEKMVQTNEIDLQNFLHCPLLIFEKSAPSPTAWVCSQANASSRGGVISTFVCSRTLSASRILTARSSVMPKYSFRSSRETWDSCTLRPFAGNAASLPRSRYSAAAAIEPKGREAFDSYLHSSPHKAFAASPGGGYAWVSTRSTAERAQADAMDNCRKSAKDACTVS
jgi:hypothetical protein